MPNSTTPTARYQEEAENRASTPGGLASEMAAKAGQQTEKLKETASSAAQSAAGQGREAGERVMEVAGNVKTAIHRSAREQPLATLAVAVALGFVAGALWKS